MEMKFNGQFRVEKPRNEVYEILSDPEKFAPLLPTFSSIKMKDDRTATLRVKVGIGRIRATASTELTLVEANAPNRARYIGQGKVMQGAYQMISSFDLEEDGDGTIIKWQGETQLVGKILSLVGGGLKGYAEKEINKLIDSLQHALSPAAEAVTAPATEGWLARILRRLRGDKGKATEVVAPAAVVKSDFAVQPAEVIAEQQKAYERINKILQVKPSEKRLTRK